MGGFVFYDLVFLALFILFVIIFLSTRKKNLERQGIVYLYKTKLGIKFIEGFAKKFEKVLKPAQWLVLASGYVLMITIVWLFVKSVYLYLTSPLVQYIKSPPVVLLVPYFPKLFGLDSFFPPFYFTYFIIAIGIVAVCHEFSHGIFMKLNKINILSTGFAFLGPILGAFVEQDEKQMSKKKKFPQMVVLAAGTFANVVMALLFFGILALFFTSAFVPAGVKFSMYAFTNVNVEDISIIGNSSIGESYVEINVNGERYFVEHAALQNSLENEIPTLFVFEDTPAFNSQIRGAITEINDIKTRDSEELSYVLGSFEVGDEVKVKTAILEPGTEIVSETREYNLTLAEREGRPYLGIVFMENGGGGFVGFFYDLFFKVKDPFTHYESSWGNFGWFVYYLLWWIVVINFLVALFNMLPLGILDGGRFFYLTIWGLTKRESWARKSYKFAMWFLLALIFVMMAKWVLRFI
ncbi:MAG: site-2 protease family protein [Nanoarchaeota archaeon]|nr:site-2 protease family protein [Nanoarchaeota archaeon]MBU1103672.1 site-2 protease family protein [Nanoarchaeota archaeon]